MSKLKNNVEKLNILIREGKLMDAFERYYKKDVILHVNGNPPIIGIAINDGDKKREAIFLQEIERLESAEVKSVTFGGINNNVSMTEWAINIENKKGDKKIIYRVNVQQWEDGKIMNEKLYFCGDQDFK